MCLILISDFQQQILYAQEKVVANLEGKGGLFKMFLFAEANSEANRLHEDLMMTYNRIVRPVQNSSDRLVVKLSLKLSQLIDVVSNE